MAKSPLVIATLRMVDHIKTDIHMHSLDIDNLICSSFQ